MPIYTNDPCDDGLFPVEPSLHSSIGIGPKVTKAIDAATKDWLDNHPEATTTVEDDSITNVKLKDGSVNSRTIENESITTDDIADLTVTTPKIADDAVTADKIASSAADGLRTMSATHPGVAKVGAGLAINNGALELNGGDITPAVTAWLDAHPEATTTVQDNSITTVKIVDGAITDDKLAQEIISSTRNINTIGVGRYDCDSYGVIAPTASTKWCGMSDKVPCKASTFYTISHSFPRTSGNFVCLYEEDGTFISRTAYSATNHYAIKTTELTGQIAVLLYDSDGVTLDTDSYIQVEEGLIPHQYVSPTSVIDEVSRYNVLPIERGFRQSINVTETPGYFAADGSIATPDENLAVYTNQIPVDLYTGFEYSISHTQNRSIWIAYVTYDTSGNFIERKVLTVDTAIGYGGIISDLTGIGYIAFCYRTYGDSTFTLLGIPSVGSLANMVNGNTTSFSTSIPRFTYCDHLFVNTPASSIVIPHESLYHVRLSKSFGFGLIEANCHATSDGVWVVNHLISGKFGIYFHHVDGVTDISNTLLSSVTWDWVVENVRYNSTIAKYQTRPCRIEEFLSECRQQGLTPLVQMNNTELIGIVESYMGKDNYIAYGATRQKCPTATISHWMNKSTKDEILTYCKSIGRPFIYGMANPTDFTDSELLEIVEALHKNGFMILVSYADTDWHKYSSMGFDIISTQQRACRIDSGNVCNINSMNGFDKYTVTGATESNGVLTFSSSGTITPDIDSQPAGTYVVDIEVSFNGTITVPAIGESNLSVYTSDGSIPFFMAAPIVHGDPIATISVSSGTVITDMTYKISAV